ncbi:TPA: hypothetical protein KOP76_002987 [Clostridioides difficile]|uniref:hypothetical protein n=1 Tax=Clostridioides difficile TaxID=1496 RepID=UPI000F60947E|nr:hypothetical protein [Clostridioides difficile]MBY1216520.1 hypothetical protein [Clostridioides difficile]MBZ1029597.1 hypothetical protein [Clostridioides difficile]MCA0852463.1 hypothetical protein [Clostridioides difficile]MCA0875243.1 hypothetical protein [Clostridioides difficile]MCJ0221966.1 hypothetical protein [Clostridioides difficile]
MKELSSQEKWYNSNIVSAIIGAVIAIAVALLTIYITEKLKIKEEKKNTIILITQTNQELFYNIYIGSKSNNNINHSKFRELVKHSSIIFIMPQNLKNEFSKMFEIYSLIGDDFVARKDEVHTHCINIVKIIEEYGVDVFE